MGTHGTTYGGNPLASAVAGAVFEFINTPEVLEGVKHRHEYFLDALNKLNTEYRFLKKFVVKAYSLVVY